MPLPTPVVVSTLIHDVPVLAVQGQTLAVMVTAALPIPPAAVADALLVGSDEVQPAAW